MYSQFQLARELKICRIFKGMWQVSGACRRIDLQKAITLHSENGDAGLTPWHLADSDRCQRLKIRGEEVLSQLPVLTPYFPRLIPMTKTLVEGLDFWQFHQSSIDRQISRKFWINLSVRVAKSLDNAIKRSALKSPETDDSVQTKRAV